MLLHHLSWLHLLSPAGVGSFCFSKLSYSSPSLADPASGGAGDTVVGKDSAGNAHIQIAAEEQAICMCSSSAACHTALCEGGRCSRSC